MKVTPNLFTTPTRPTRPAPDASEARRAFEAMLMAGAARRPTQAVEVTAAPSPSTMVSTPSPVTEPAQPLSRPGRVLDIRV